MKYSSYVDVFHGSGCIDLPKAEGIAASWKFIKALCGNTHPGATLPFGRYSVCPYSGGYSAGYGTNALNCGGPVPQIMDKLRLKGFSHFQNSGTGAIGVYYNYAVVTPYVGEKREFYDIAEECASPGYYAVTLTDDAVRCELTVDVHAALHRYTFAQAGGKIGIDFENDGLYEDRRLRGKADNPVITQMSGHELRASVTLQDVRMHFVCRFFGDGALNEANEFCLCGKGSAALAVSVSTTSMEDAVREADRAVTDFDAARITAEQAWEDALGRIEIETEDETEARLFYSNLYHSFVKPCDWGDGGFLWEGAPFVTDFITLWDMYKTALPLIFTLFPALSAHICGTYEKLAETLGTLPNCFMLARNFNLESKQSRLIAVHLLYDAWIRGVEADWEAIVRHILHAIFADSNRDFLEKGDCARPTHTLDMAENCAAAEEMARALGMTEEADRLAALKGRWRNAFSPLTGMMLTGYGRQYYEGTEHNYSFRPMRDMQERIRLCRVGRFESILDCFFGFTPVDDITPFEGFNNETDMEAPYAYAYIGSHKKLCAVLDAADRYMFRDKNGGAGRGAIPGNNDSGGLSSCYIWNTLGIFPVTGQNRMLIARPKFRRSVLHLASGLDLIIERLGDGAYPKSASLDGESCTDLRFPVSRMMQGGTLIVET